MENLSGQTIKGYELMERIGAGSFGAVYRTYQSTVGREVALKVILPGFANHPSFIRRFEMEAQLIARLEHLHIVPLYDYWRDPSGAYLAMRWLRGGSLKEVVSDRPLSTQEAARLLDQIGSALATAHRNDIVHRDLKPSNILLDEEGNAYLADFGIALDKGVPAGGAEEGEAIVGSPAYLSPEQARRELVTVQSDIYSLGVTLYESLTGKHPYAGASPVECLYKQLHDPLPQIETLDPEVQDEVNAIIQKATAKNPRHRYQEVLELVAAYREAVNLDEEGRDQSLVESLTPREQQILSLIVSGQTNKRIAQTLFIEVSTVKWYITQIYRKLNVRSRVQAIARARDLDLIVSTTETDLGTAQKTSTNLVLPEPVNPYKGLRAFEPADNRHFFGREALVEHLLSRLAPTNTSSSSRSALGLDQNGAERFLAIVGPSGSGKSSLIKAGLIPALWIGQLAGSDKWFIVDMLPGARPLENLEIALTRIAADQAGNLREHLDRDARGLARAAILILPNDESELVVVIDQFEELFNLVEDESKRQHFIDLILGAVTDPRSRVRVVIALRADYYDRPLQYPAFGELIRGHLETLLPLSAEELERVIVNPANQNGVTFEPGLVATIIEDVNYRPGALPLLQYALAELFEQRDGCTLTQSAYLALGGAAGALTRRAEELYQEQDTEGRDAIRQMFLRLVSVGDHTKGFASDVPSLAYSRRRVLRAELLSASSSPEQLDEIIDTYADYRLLSLNYDAATRRATVEVAHEAILREWDRLKDWLEESRVDLRLHDQLVRATREWTEAGGDQSFLLRGTRLKRFESWVSDTSLVLSEDERAYLEASLGQREAREAVERERDAQEARLERQANRRLKALVAVMAVALLVAVGLAIAAVSFAQRVEEQQRLIEEKVRLNSVQELASAAQANLEVDPELSVLLALEAVKTTYSIDGTVLPEVEGLLHKAIQADLVHSTIRFGGVAAYSPDGKTLAIGNQYGVLKLLDIASGKNIWKQTIHRPLINDIAFSPDGRFLATSNRDTLVKIWDVASNQNIGTIRIQARINGLSFSPNGQQLVTAGADGAVRIWDLDPVTNRSSEDAEPVELAEQAVILQTPGEAVDLAYSSDGQRLAVLSPGKSIVVMDAVSGEQLLEIAGISYFAQGVTFSPEGKFMVSSSSDMEATVWDVRTGEEILTVRESAIIVDVSFSPDGRYLATATEDGETTLWAMETGLEALKFSGHSSRINGISFSPDGQQLVTSGNEGTTSTGMTRIWNVNPTGEKLFTIAAHEGKVHDAVYNAEGTKIASAGEDGAVKVWDAATGKLLHSLPGQKEWVHFPVFSLDDQRLAAANREGGVTIWDANTGEELLSVHGDAYAFTAVAFSPDGSQLAAGGRDGIAHIWDAITGERLTNISYDGDLITGIFFTPDGDQIRTYDFEGCEVAWDAVTGAPQDVYVETHNRCKRWGDGVYWGGDPFYWDVEFTTDGRLGAAAFTSVGRLGAAACSPTSVFRASDKLENEGNVYWLNGAGRDVTGVAFNPEGTILATSNTNGAVRLWGMATGEEIVTLSDRMPSLGGVDISPDGRYLATAGSDGTVSVFVISIEELMELAQSRLSRGFTEEECRTYLHQPSCVGN